jgi:hypothetical protein
MAGLLAKFAERYNATYGSEADLPADAEVRDAAGRWLGFNDGFVFRFGIVSRGLFSVRVSHSDLEASAAASFGDHVYVWILGMWLKVYDSPLVVA